MWQLLLAPLQAIISGLGTYYQNKLKLDELKAETARQVELAKQQYATEIAKAELEKSQIILQSTSPLFKYFTFVMWFGPFIMGLFFPEVAKELFANLAYMPEWYVTSCVAIMFTVWGISVGGPVVNNIFTNLGSFFESRRQYKLEKAKIDRAQVFKDIRAQKGYVSGDDVKLGDKIIDAIEKGLGE